jgi:hemerythrin-like domain-containing protein
MYNYQLYLFVFDIRLLGPIGVMLSEHDSGRQFVRGMSEAAAAYKGGDKPAGKSFAENARGYIDLLGQHINKEDNILYPMADKIFSAEKQSELSEDFKKVDSEQNGVEDKELAILHRLADIYLAS